ncbi:branched-chain amino acid transport system II carrier protein [Photobacterium sp. SDRW27]|uniref:branched-chain amino acid transport system II carrier protein n=1 Tax=Photobacterium obscurum TaxID=2829490 RepID=UPI0022434B1B|nr:branched-chain amino acid transport system II carrier protein [Photobacterium obscurum]MCW8330087.1 branched-chain amino acid transport system II carrier protein [Photobacterium obscurum]
MKKTLKTTDILALGFMTFAFFLGAGNIIFPPQAGQQAGEHLVPAMLGFLSTGVSLPLIAIIAVAVAGGWKGLTRDLPSKAATLLAVLIFIVIGPAFAAPRAGLVAYEMGVKPFIADAGQLSLTIFSIVFFAIALFLSRSRGNLVDMVGKFLTPILFIALVALAVAVVVNPQDAIEAAKGDYVEMPFIKGFVEGYNTLDAVAALLFGMVIVDAVRSKGVTDEKATRKYLVSAGLIAAAGLAFVYVSLFYLGATSVEIAANASNGGDILAIYVAALFGPAGQVILSLIVLLACLTTVVGLLSACSEYFSTLTSWSYEKWVTVLAVICCVVANVGLNQLIKISLPALFALYPIAMALVILTFIRRWLPNPALSYRVVMLVALSFSMIDAAKVSGFDVTAFQIIPLFDYGMAWLMPTFVALVITRFVGGQAQPQEAQTA